MATEVVGDVVFHVDDPASLPILSVTVEPTLQLTHVPGLSFAGSSSKLLQLHVSLRGLIFRFLEEREWALLASVDRQLRELSSSMDWEHALLRWWPASDLAAHGPRFTKIALQDLLQQLRLPQFAWWAAGRPVTAQRLFGLWARGDDISHQHR